MTNEARIAKALCVALARGLAASHVKRLRCAVRRSRMSPKGHHAQNFGFAFGFWPCVGGPYLRVQLSSWTVEVWYGVAGYKLYQ